MKNLNRHIQKISAFLISVGLWFYVLNTEVETDSKNFFLEFVTPPGFNFSSPPPEYLNIRLKGPKAFLDTYLAGEKSLLVDLNLEKRKKGNRYTVDISNYLSNLPYGVEVEEIRENPVSIRVSKEIRKKVKISLKTSGKISSSQKLVSGRVFPREVFLRGAKNILKNIKVLETKPVDLERLSGEGTLELEFRNLPSFVNLEGPAPEYRYKVVPNQINFVLKDVPVRFLSSKTVEKASQRTVSLLVYLEDEERNLSISDVQVVADIPEGAKNNVKIELSATLPSDVHLLEINPPEIEVKLK